MKRLPSSFRAGCAYFLAIFAAGCAFSPIRQTFLFMGVEPFTAALLEAPVMALVMYLAAAGIGRTLAIPARIRARLAMGATGISLTLAAALLTDAAVRGWRLDFNLSEVLTPAEYVSGAVLVLGLLMPALQMWDSLAAD